LELERGNACLTAMACRLDYNWIDGNSFLTLRDLDNAVIQFMARCDRRRNVVEAWWMAKNAILLIMMVFVL
jgi:hypothetical protein